MSVMKQILANKYKEKQIEISKHAISIMRLARNQVNEILINLEIIEVFENCEAISNTNITPSKHLIELSDRILFIRDEFTNKIKQEIRNNISSSEEAFELYYLTDEMTSKIKKQISEELTKFNNKIKSTVLLTNTILSTVIEKE